MSRVILKVFIMSVILCRVKSIPASFQGVHVSPTDNNSIKMTSSSRNNSTDQVIFTVRVRTNEEDNLKSGQCPNGEVFTLACNRCRCNIETGVTLCTASLCTGWSCPREHRHECFGRCPCNSNTLITSCEKKSCINAVRTSSIP